MLDSLTSHSDLEPPLQREAPHEGSRRSFSTFGFKLSAFPGYTPGTRGPSALLNSYWVKSPPLVARGAGRGARRLRHSAGPELSVALGSPVVEGAPRDCSVGEAAAMTICQFFLQGRCRFGERCWNKHPGAWSAGGGRQQQSSGDVVLSPPPPPAGLGWA